MTTEKEQLVLTAVWRNGGFSASYDSLVVGSSAVLRLNFCAKLKICASIAPPSQSPKPLGASVTNRTADKERQKFNTQKI